VMKTPLFYEGACKRLDDKLGRSYDYAACHFGGPNLYLDAMRKNADYALSISESGQFTLRRKPPNTLVRP